jgi:superfamily II DNA or RNA helicase
MTVIQFHCGVAGSLFPPSEECLCAVCITLANCLPNPDGYWNAMAELLAQTREKSAGVYVATNPDCDYVKVGHTQSLGDRLHDSGYRLTWPHEWVMEYAFETKTKDEAEALEQASFKVFDRAGVRLRRTGGEVPREDMPVPGEMTELMDVREGDPLAFIRGVIAGTAQAVNIATVQVRAPQYAKSLALGAAPRKLTKRQEKLRAKCAGAAEAADGILAAARGNPEAFAAGAQTEFPMGNSRPAAPARYGDRKECELEELMAAACEEVCAADAETEAPFEVEERAYQTACVRNACEALTDRGRTRISLCCRSGKTYVGMKIAAQMARPNSVVLVFVPNLPLLRQTAVKLTSYGVGRAGPRQPGNPRANFLRKMLMVGSDSTNVAGGGKMTTDPRAIEAFVAGVGKTTASVVVSTYQSSAVLLGALGAADVSLVVFDEAHRICGSDKPRLFSLAHRHFLAPAAHEKFPQTSVLYMTATPDLSGAAINMRDNAAFGGESYRYALSRGVADGYVNPFRLVFFGGGYDCAAYPQPDARGKGRELYPTKLVAELTLDALRRNDDVRRMVVYASSTKMCDRICAEFNRQAPDGFAAGVVAHSKLKPARVTDAIRQLASNPTTPGAPARVVLFNCRMLQEGVDLPWLNAVMFVTPKNSAKDIIQSICRTGNRPGNPRGDFRPPKGVSKVFLPVVYACANYETEEAVGFGDALAAKTEEPAGDEGGGDEGGGGEGAGDGGAGDEGGGDEGAGDEEDLEEAQGVVQANARDERADCRILNAPEMAPLLAENNVRRLLPIVAVVDALLADDTRLLDWVLRRDGGPPQEVPGAGALVEWQAAPSLSLPNITEGELMRYLRRFVRTNGKAAELGARADRFFTWRRYPWDRAYAQLQRTTAGGAGRYPKTRDTFVDDPTRRSSFFAYFNQLKREYEKLKAHDPTTTMEPYQARQLEELPFWDTYGRYGPYFAPVVLDQFEAHLEQEGEPPVISIGNGENITLAASWRQRLSGVFRIVNQQDSDSKGRVVNLASDFMQRLRQICEKYGLRLFKARRAGPHSRLDPAGPDTYGQASSKEFNKLWKDQGPSSGYFRNHFTGYGTAAYKRQESPHVYGTPQLIPQKVRDAAAARKK